MCVMVCSGSSLEVKIETDSNDALKIKTEADSSDVPSSGKFAYYDDILRSFICLYDINGLQCLMFHVLCASLCFMYLNFT